MLRTYTRNSPEAAARIVALVLISDGHVCRSEIEVLHRLNADRELGLPPGGVAQVMHTLCEELLMGSSSGAMMCAVDEHALASLLAEVDDPALQRRVLWLAEAAVQADQHQSDAEALVIEAARRQWHMAEDPAPWSRVGNASRAAAGAGSASLTR